MKEKEIKIMKDAFDSSRGIIRHDRKVFCVNCVLIVFAMSSFAIAVGCLFHFLTK